MGLGLYLQLAYDEPYRTNDLFREIERSRDGDYVFLERRDGILFAKNRLIVSASWIENVIRGQDYRIKNVALVEGQSPDQRWRYWSR